MPTRRAVGEDHVGAEDVLAVDEDLAGDAHPLDEVVHAVEAAEQGGFAAARGPDDGGDLPGVGIEADTRRATLGP